MFASHVTVLVEVANREVLEHDHEAGLVWRDGSVRSEPNDVERVSGITQRVDECADSSHE